MIKFIACDLDGTLLNSSKELPRDLRATVERLNKIGVTFAPASGRQYYKVLEQFEPISRNFMYIAENGAFVIKDGEVIVRDCLSGAVALDVIKRTRKLPSVYPILCCEDCAYMEVLSAVISLLRSVSILGDWNLCPTLLIIVIQRIY